MTDCVKGTITSPPGLWEHGVAHVFWLRRLNGYVDWCQESTHRRVQTMLENSVWRQVESPIRNRLFRHFQHAQ